MTLTWMILIIFGEVNHLHLHSLRKEVFQQTIELLGNLIDKTVFLLLLFLTSITRVLNQLYVCSLQKDGV
jgi:hypothetical protein